MAIKKSAKKAAKRALKNYEVNLSFKLAMKKSIKDFLKSVELSADKKDVVSLLNVAYSKIDKATKQWILKKQTAARKKSRLAKKVS